ncbi:hypothetical protein PC110_g4322 [Phytophthora cactorum]|uniref:DDE-1 domain-containing protein n=1 Tax=Phytophthora cactorum TaxID=29920 RepID=A0A329SUI7_9STRA|nr:hypothetical protein PC110_g4322 [Phytophthora cactorum]
MDKAHFVFNMDNGKTLGFRGGKSVRYQDEVSGGEGITLVIKIRNGASARIEPLMVIFQNANGSYPIRGADPVPGVAYLSGPKGWMGERVFGEWIANNTCNSREPRSKRQIIFVDNASGHEVDEY